MRGRAWKAGVVNLTDLNPSALYHLASSVEWAAYQASGEITPASLEAEGFIHCSYGHQVPGTVAKHFEGATDLLALELDPAALGGVRLVDEDLYNSGQAFPHAYGALPAASVQAIVTLL